MKSTPRLSLWAAALALVLTACGDKKDDPKTPGGDKAKTPAAGKGPATPKAPAIKPIEVPKDLLLYGGTNGAEATLTQLHALASKVTADVPPLAQMAAPAMQGEFRLKDAKGLDLKKSLRFAVFDRKAYGRAPEALLVGASTPEAFAASLPDHDRKQNVEGNAWSYLKFPGSKQPVYVNFAGGHAVITRSPKLFPSNKAFFEALVAAPLPDAGAVIVELENVMRLHGAEFDKAIKDGKDLMKMAGGASPQAESQLGAVNAMLDWATKAARDAERAQVSLVIGDGLKIDFRLTPKAGSTLAKQMEMLAGTGKADLLASLPASAPVFFTAALDPNKAAQLSASMTTAFMTDPIFKGDATKSAPYEKAVMDYMRGMDGQLAVAAYPSAKGLELLGVFGVRDAKMLRAAQKTMAGLYSDPAATAYYDSMGVGIEFKQAAYTVGDVPVDVQRTTLKNMPPEALAMAGMMSDLFVQHIAIGSKMGIIAYGESGRGTVEGLLGGTAKGGLNTAPGAKRVIKGAAPGFFMLTYVNPIELAKGVKLGGMNPLAAMLADVKASSGVGFSGAVNGGALQLLFDVPLETLKEGMAAFEKTKGSF